MAEFVQRQIVDIVAKWVFNFAPDGGNPEDDIGANDGSRDGDPSERAPKLEWEGNYVDPGDLGDGNGVGNGKRGVEYPFGASKDFVEGAQRSHGHRLVSARRKSSVANDRLDVGG